MFFEERNWNANKEIAVVVCTCSRLHTHTRVQPVQQPLVYLLCGVKTTKHRTSDAYFCAPVAIVYVSDVGSIVFFFFSRIFATSVIVTKSFFIIPDCINCKNTYKRVLSPPAVWQLGVGRPCAIYFGLRRGSRVERGRQERKKRKKLISRDRLLPARNGWQPAEDEQKKTNLPRKRSDVIIIDGATCAV